MKTTSKHINAYKKVVHAAIWKDNRIFLSKRIEKGDFHKGFWQDPGGKMEDGETPVKAILREVEEETGLEFCKYEIEFVDCFIYKPRKIKSFIFTANLEDGFWPDNNEPDKQTDWELFTINEALKLKLMPSVRYYLTNHYKCINDNSR